MAEANASDPKLVLAEINRRILSLSTQIRSLRGILETGDSPIVTGPETEAAKSQPTIEAQKQQLLNLEKKTDKTPKDLTEIQRLKDIISHSSTEASMSIQPPQPKNGASNWQTIVVHYDQSAASDKTEKLTTSTTTEVNLDGWFWSIGGSKTESKASVTHVSSMDAR